MSSNESSSDSPAQTTESKKSWSPPRPRRILIIGAGPVGLVTLRNFLHRAEFDTVQLVERRDEVGGVWYLDPPSNSLNSTDSENQRPRWPSPAYPGLMGNVLPQYLSFSGSPFPPLPSAPDQPFPNLIQTQEYLLRFAEPLRPHIRLSTEVVRVDELEDGKGWDVVLRDWNLRADQDEPVGKEVVERWDAVVIATAWYDNPKWPDIHGLEELKQAGIAKHAKEWMGPRGVKAFKGKRVLVIGNANSANDIATQLAQGPEPDLSSSPPETKRQSECPIYPIYRSIRRPNMHYFPIVPHPNLEAVAAVEMFSVTYNSDNDPSAGEGKEVGKSKVTATAHLADGTTLSGIDYVFFGTGYAYYIPFVRVLSPPFAPSSPSSSPTLKPLCTTPPTPTSLAGIQIAPVPSLHRHILYALNPTLAFLGGVVSATPFILGDLTSSWVALFWCPPSSTSSDNMIPFPASLADRLESEQTRLKTVSSILSSVSTQDPTTIPTSLITYHVLGPGELEYARELWGDVVKLRPDLVPRKGSGMGGDEGEGQGLVEWTDEMWAEKEAMFGLKNVVLRREAGVPVEVNDEDQAGDSKSPAGATASANAN